MEEKSVGVSTKKKNVCTFEIRGRKERSMGGYFFSLLRECLLHVQLFSHKRKAFYYSSCRGGRKRRRGGVEGKEV